MYMQQTSEHGRAQVVGDGGILQADLQGHGGAPAGEVDGRGAGCQGLRGLGHRPPHLPAPPFATLTEEQTS